MEEHPIDECLTFFNPWEEIETSRNHLPHWQQPGATYFITFRLADAIPSTMRAEFEEEKAGWLKHHPAKREDWDEAATAEYHQRFSGKVESWLDAGHGSCFLRDPTPRSIVANALRHFDSDRYLLHSAIVMPNHVHALVSLRADDGDGGLPLQSVLHSWKSFTSHQITKNRGGSGSAPSPPKPFWQEDYFDRLVRDAAHFRNCARYIRRNPEKAKLPMEAFDLYESELTKSVE